MLPHTEARIVDVGLLASDSIMKCQRYKINVECLHYALGIFPACTVYSISHSLWSCATRSACVQIDWIVAAMTSSHRKIEGICGALGSDETSGDEEYDRCTAVGPWSERTIIIMKENDVIVASRSDNPGKSRRRRVSYACPRVRRHKLGRSF